MSSTELTPQQREALVAFYETYVLPLAAHPETAQLEPSRSDDADASFYVVRAKPALSKQDFEVPTADPARIVEALEKMWAGTPLTAVPQPFFALMEHFTTQKERSEVSAFIYEMF